MAEIGVHTAQAWERALTDLVELRAWQPLDMLVERVLDALRGHGHLDARDIARLRDWPVRWRALHPDVRGYYVWAVRTRSDAGRSALWNVLNRERPVDWVRHAIEREYLDLYGQPAAHPLLPHILS